jgi:hypothetical protein
VAGDRPEVGATEAWVDENVVHRHPGKALSSAPTFAELDEALEAVGDIFIRWNAIIADMGLISIQPFPQYEWVALLRVPWIVD